MYAKPYSDGTLLSVWIQPRASKTMLTGVYGDSIKIVVKSPPVEGQANEECIRFLSAVLGLPKRRFEIKSGQQSRRKGIYIKGIPPEKVVAVLRDIVKNL